MHLARVHGLDAVLGRDYLLVRRLPHDRDHEVVHFDTCCQQCLPVGAAAVQVSTWVVYVYDDETVGKRSVP